MKKTTLTLLALAMLATSAFAGSYRVFYNIRGDKSGRLGKFSTIAPSKCDVREALLAAEPKAINIQINFMDEADYWAADGTTYVMRPAGSVVEPDLVENETAYLLAGSEKAKKAKKLAMETIATKQY